VAAYINREVLGPVFRNPSPLYTISREEDEIRLGLIGRNATSLAIRRTAPQLAKDDEAVGLVLGLARPGARCKNLLAFSVKTKFQVFGFDRL